MDTRTWSSRSAARCGSCDGEPIEKLPAGTTTISGQSAQSLKRSPAPGVRQLFSPVLAVTLTASQCCGVAGVIASMAIAQAMATPEPDRATAVFIALRLLRCQDSLLTHAQRAVAEHVCQTPPMASVS